MFDIILMCVCVCVCVCGKSKTAEVVVVVVAAVACLMGLSGVWCRIEGVIRPLRHCKASLRPHFTQ